MRTAQIGPDLSLEQKTPKYFRVRDEIRAHDPLSFRSDALSTELDDHIA